MLKQKAADRYGISIHRRPFLLLSGTDFSVYGKNESFCAKHVYRDRKDDIIVEKTGGVS